VVAPRRPRRRANAGRPWPHHPGTAETFDRLRASLGAAEFEHNWAGARQGRATTSEVTTAIPDVVGRPAIAFEQFAADYADRFTRC
jgi:hypothetical protein